MDPKCPKCGAQEVPAETPFTVYACGSKDYDQRPGTFVQKCSPTQVTGGMEERFDAEWKDFPYANLGEVSDTIKDFIRQEITLALTHDRARLVEEVEKNSHEAIGTNGIRTTVVDVDVLKSLLKDKGVE